MLEVKLRKEVINIIDKVVEQNEFGFTIGEITYGEDFIKCNENLINFLQEKFKGSKIKIYKLNEIEYGYLVDVKETCMPSGCDSCLAISCENGNMTLVAYDAVKSIKEYKAK